MIISVVVFIDIILHENIQTYLLDFQVRFKQQLKGEDLKHLKEKT